jgi:transcriptional regulator GlxA family with amidase domain
MGPHRVDEDGHGVRTAEGLRVEDVSGPDVVDEADLVVMPSWPTDLPATQAVLTGRIRAAQSLGSRVASLCLGAFPVVDSGLLGREVVTRVLGGGGRPG